MKQVFALAAVMSVASMGFSGECKGDFCPIDQSQTLSQAAPERQGPAGRHDSATLKNTTSSQKDQYKTPNDRKLGDDIHSNLGTGFENVFVVIEDGNVLLIGTVDSKEKSQDAEKKTRNTSGVKKVENRIDVKK